MTFSCARRIVLSLRIRIVLSFAFSTILFLIDARSASKSAAGRPVDRREFDIAAAQREVVLAFCSSPGLLELADEEAPVAAGCECSILVRRKRSGGRRSRGAPAGVVAGSKRGMIKKGACLIRYSCEEMWQSIKRWEFPAYDSRELENVEIV